MNDDPRKWMHLRGYTFAILLFFLKKVADVRTTHSGKIYIETRVKNRESRWWGMFKKLGRV